MSCEGSADLEALQQADTCVLVLPCGRSAHTEAGWMAGAGKRVIAYIPEMVEPELMYKLFDKVVSTLDDLVQCFCYDGEIQEAKPLDEYSSAEISTFLLKGKNISGLFGKRIPAFYRMPISVALWMRSATLRTSILL